MYFNIRLGILLLCALQQLSGMHYSVHEATNTT